MSDKASGSGLAAEREDLRARLADAEDVLRAIGNGEVDAVVVTGERGKQIYTLSGADITYRQLIETMSEGAVTVSADGIILYGNPRLAEMLGWPLDQVLGTALHNYLPPADGQALDAILVQARTEPTRREINLKPSDDRLVPVHVSASRLQNLGAELVFCLVLTDLTEQKSHEQVAAAERLARLILEQTAEAIVVCDEQGRVVRASLAALRFCDGSPLLRPFAEAFPLRTALSDRFRLAPILRGEALRDVDVALEREGQRFDLILNAGPLFDDQRGVGCVVTLTDITERRRAEHALRESERRLKEAQRVGRIGHWDFDLVTRHILWSDMVFALYERDPKLGPPSLEEEAAYYSPEDAERLHQSARRAVETGKPNEIDFRLNLPGGRHALAVARATPVTDAHGHVIRVMGTVQDITERKRNEENLRDSEARFRSLFDESADGILIADIETRLFKDANPTLCRMLGYTVDELRTMTVRDIHPKDVVHSVLARFEAQARADRTQEVDVPCQRKDGSVVYADIGATTISFDGKPCRVGMFRDVTGRKRAKEETVKFEAQLRQAQKMESVGRLAGGVAHDFNNMLGVILGHVELALAQTDPSLSLHADLEEILKATLRSSDLTRQLLAFARKQTVMPRILDLNETVAGMLQMLHRLIGEDIELKWQPQLGLWPVKLDPSQIDQILANLCVNARDAISGVGHLTVQTGNSTLDEHYCAGHPGCVPGDYVQLTVTDDGCGMGKDTEAHIFEPFFTTKAMGKGTGLGLATVYGIVKQNNGFINVDSEPNYGTTFSIYLPRHVGKAEQAGTEVVARQASRGQETILLVEDEPAILMLARTMLERRGYTVLAAGTPGEAIRLAREHIGEIHLLMTDVVMPEMNGRILARNLLSLYPQLKRLFMSGYTSDVIAHQGILDEGVHFIQKPFSSEELATIVRDTLDSAS